MISGCSVPTQVCEKVEVVNALLHLDRQGERGMGSKAKGPTEEGSQNDGIQMLVIHEPAG